jgi:hypothetical protein
MDPPLTHSFRKVYDAIKEQSGNTITGLSTTGRGIEFMGKADLTRDGRQFINLPHNNRIYEKDWGYTTNSMGDDGQRIGQYARPLDDWFDKLKR